MSLNVFQDFALIIDGNLELHQRRRAVLRFASEMIIFFVVLYVGLFLFMSRVEKFDVAVSDPDAATLTTHSTVHSAAPSLDSVISSLGATSIITSSLSALPSQDISSASVADLGLDAASIARDKEFAKQIQVAHAVKQAKVEQARAERKAVIASIERMKSSPYKTMIVWNDVSGVEYSVYRQLSGEGYVRLNDTPFVGGVYYDYANADDIRYIVMEVSDAGEKNVTGVRTSFIDNK